MKKTLLSLVILCGALAARADLVTGFEPPDYNGSAAGTKLTGQQGWYIPSAGGTDSFCYTYAGNALGLPANPNGSTQFIGGECIYGTSSTYVRAQHDVDFSAGGAWIYSYDTAATYLGTLPALNNIGSGSLQDSTIAKYFIVLAQWVDPNTAANWNIVYQFFDASGGGSGTYTSPGPAWSNLLPSHWYHVDLAFNLTTNVVTSAYITDLATGVTTGVKGSGWYLAGGANSTLPLPTAVRFFIGGAQTGNAVGYDNMMIAQLPNTFYPYAYAATRGTEQGSHDILKLKSADDNPVVISQKLQVSPALANAEVTANLMVEDPLTVTAATVTVVVKANDTPYSDPTCTQKILLKNQTTGSYELVDERKPTGSYSTITVALDANGLAKYMAANGEVDVRVGEFHGKPLSAGWTESTDQIKIDVTR